LFEEQLMPEPNEAPRRGWRALRNDQFSGLFLLLFALYLYWENLAYPVGSLSEPGPGYVPLMLAIFLGAMGLLTMIFSGGSRLLEMKWVEAPHAAIVLIACGVATFALERIGYRLTIIALLIFLLGVLERKRPLPVAIVSVGFAFISYYIVGDLLLVPLPHSPWGF
jgi:putative tricarboxylic transport membrane protein